MKGLDRWKLAEELNIYQLTLLVAGYDPAELPPYESDWPRSVRQEVTPFLSAIQNAAKSGKVQARLVNTYNGDAIDWAESTVEVESFVAWMRHRNFADGFFIPTGSEVSGISDTSSPFYAAKLAAAVRAWSEVTSDPAALSGKSPKKALEIWLRKHANEYGLTGKDGNPNRLGIEEICKVANWRPSGGASPTPSFEEPPTPSVRMGRQVPSKASHLNRGNGGGSKPAPIEDDIPF